MITIPLFPIRYQRRTHPHEGVESLGAILKRVRRLHEARITGTFDHGLSLTLDALLEREEAQR